MEKQVAIVVGASRGIGRQVAIDLAKNGYAVVIAGKTTSDASKTVKKYKRIDVLVCKSTTILYPI